MFRKAFSFGGLLLLAGAAVLVMSDSVRAQHRGGGHFGGAHLSGGHVGGAHFGGYRGGFYRGGYGYAHAYHYPHYGYSHYYGHYGYRNYYPYYGAYGYYPYYDAYPYAGASPTYDSWYYGSYGDLMPSYSDGSASVTPPSVSYQALYLPATAQPDTSARVTVSAPTGARLWFDNTPTTSTGSVREFTTPPLTPGSRYTYDIKASWNENGHEVTQARKVEVTAGAHVNVDFPVPPKTAGQASADTNS